MEFILPFLKKNQTHSSSHRRSLNLRKLSLLSGLTTLFIWLGPAAFLFADDALLSWDPSPDADVIGYQVYHGTASRQYAESINVGNTTDYTFSIAGEGVHYFAVTAYKQGGAESDFSNEVSKTVAASAPSAAPQTGGGGGGGCAMHPASGQGPLDAAEVVAIFAAMLLQIAKKMVHSYKRKSPFLFRRS